MNERAINRIRWMYKALRVIEFYTCDDFVPTEELLNMFYRFVHAALGDCLAGHEPWLDELDRKYNELKEGGQIG